MTCESHARQYKITLDGKTLRTPARNPLEFKNKSLASAIAAEWDAQTDERRGIEPATMPLMTLASTAIDQIQFDRYTSIANCMKYLPTDSALFHTDEMDRILLAKQRKHLNPAVRWLSRVIRSEIPTTTSVSGRIQHAPETVAAIESILHRMVSISHFLMYF
jgi:chaperone required for assembly of F1-ATPase